MRSQKVDYDTQVETGEPPTIDDTAIASAAGLVTKGIAAAQKGDRDVARSLLIRATEIDSANGDAWMWLASISEYPEELLTFLNNVVAIDPSNQRAVEWHAATRSLLAKTLVQRGIEAHDQGNVNLATSCFDDAVEHDEECVPAWLWKARVAEADEQKVQYLERVLELDAGNEEALNAIAPFREPTPQQRFEDAKWAAVAGRRSEAMQLLDEVLEKAPDNAEAWILRSHFSLDLRDKLSALERALEIEPDNHAARAGYDFLKATVNGVQGQAEQNMKEPLPIDDSSIEDDEGPWEAIVETAESDTTQDQSQSEQETVEMDAPQDGSDCVTSEYDDAITAEIIDVTPFSEFAQEPAATDVIVGKNDGNVASEFVADADFEKHFDDASEVLDDAMIAEYSDEPQVVGDEICDFCEAPVHSEAFECGTCHAMLTLSDIESLLANSHADHAVIDRAVTTMEAEWNTREFSVPEMTVLAIGHFNLGNFERGFKYLQEASRIDPNNVILAGQVNALAIRLDEIRRQGEIDGSKPKGKSILVVDDSATVRKLISAKLEKSGHHVTCAADGVDGLEKLSVGMPDLVLLDIEMPRMDGYEVCKQIRSNPAAADIPVVMISGKDGFFDKVRGKMAGCTGYVTKPFGPETLMKALETYLLPENGHAE